MNKITGVVLGVLAGATMTLAGTSGAATTSHACQGSDSAATRYVVNGGSTLNAWMKRHDTSLGNVVQLTVNCEDGGLDPAQSKSLITDLNRERFNRPLARGTVLWTL